MKAKIVKFGPYILLGLLFLMLVFLNIFYQDHWLDSDMAAEMIFSRILAETGHVFATPEWYYSTEFRFLYTQLVMGPLFHILSDWHVIRTITNIVFYGLMLASYFYFMKPFKVSGSLTALTACILLLPFSETMMTHMQMGNTYMSHVIIVFLFFGMFLRLSGKAEYKIWQKGLLLACYIVLAVICGVSGVRYLLALQCPLVLTAFFSLLKTGAFQSFRKEMNRIYFKEIFSTPPAAYFKYSILGAVGSVAGYGINVVWVSHQYVFQTYDATNFIAIYQGELFDRLQNAIGCLLMLFGYIPDKGFLSLRGIISMIAFVLFGVLVYCTVKGLKRFSGERYFVALFLAVAFWLNLFVFTFTTSTMVPRYYITILIFALPVIAFYLEEEKLPFDKVAVAVLLALCLMLSTAKTVLSFVTADKNEDKRQVAAFLQENNYDFGFATFTNGNIITELTNGEVEIGNIGDPQYLEYFKWSSPMKYYEEDYHTGEVFLLLTAEEIAEYAQAEAVVSGERVYEDGSYVVLLYEGVATLMSYADVR
ncbi:MAG: hypothetical protein E7291_01220 [Lachnospiraceae bacterium]|nr:hypothetical protein [Lachnospiraceae bacterium]